MHLSMHAHTIVSGEHAVASTIRTMRPVPYFFLSPQVPIPDWACENVYERVSIV